MSSKPEKRTGREIIPELYVLRGLALLGIVFQHALGVYIRRENIPFADAAMIGMFFNFTKFAVPAFVFAAGTALFYNYYDRLNYPSFIKKRALEILLPYLLWTVIYEVYYYGIPSVSTAWLAEFARNIVLGTEAYHLWFVVLIFQFYLFYPLLLALFKIFRAGISSPLRYTAAIALFGALYAALMWLSSSFIPLHNLHLNNKFLQLYFIDYRDRNFIYFLFYFILGGIAGVSMAKWREFITKSASWNGFLFVGLFILIGYELMKSASWAGVNLNYSTSLKPSMFFYTVSEILLFYGLAMVIAKNGSWIFKFLDQIGRLSYGIYLSHALVLVYAVRAVDRALPSGQPLWLSVMAFMLCAMVSWGIVVLISRVPYGSILIGPNKKRTAAGDL